MTSGAVLGTLVRRGLEVVAHYAPLRVLFLDLDVALVDHVEHRSNVVYAELVEAQVSEMRLQVDADTALVAGRPTALQTLASRQPGVEPLRHGDLGVQGLPCLEAAAALCVVRCAAPSHTPDFQRPSV